MYGTRRSRRGPSYWNNALITALILLGPAIEDSANGKSVLLASVVRAGLFVAVALYAWVTVWMLERWRRRRAAGTARRGRRLDEGGRPPRLVSWRRVTASRGALLACCVAGLFSAQGSAETTGDGWTWDATVYLWLPSLSGETAFPPSDGGPAVDVSAEAVLDSLEAVFMGTLEARRDRWGVATDLVYVDFAAGKKATRQFGLGDLEVPAAVAADLKLGITGWLWSLEGNHAMVQRDGLSMAVLAGVRMLDIEERLHYTLNGDISSLPVVERSGSAQNRQTQWDAILGLKGRALLGDERRWYVPFRADVGAGESDLTWQFVLGLGYSFESVDVLGVWRHLDYDLGDVTPIRSIEFDGPAIGVTYTF